MTSGDVWTLLLNMRCFPDGFEGLGNFHIKGWSGCILESLHMQAILAVVKDKPCIFVDGAAPWGWNTWEIQPLLWIWKKQFLSCRNDGWCLLFPLECQHQGLPCSAGGLILIPKLCRYCVWKDPSCQECTSGLAFPQWQCFSCQIPWKHGLFHCFHSPVLILKATKMPSSSSFGSAWAARFLSRRGIFLLTNWISQSQNLFSRHYRILLPNSLNALTK